MDKNIRVVSFVGATPSAKTDDTIDSSRSRRADTLCESHRAEVRKFGKVWCCAGHSREDGRRQRSGCVGRGTLRVDALHLASHACLTTATTADPAKDSHARARVELQSGRPDPNSYLTSHSTCWDTEICRFIARSQRDRSTSSLVYGASRYDGEYHKVTAIPSSFRLPPLHRPLLLVHTEEAEFVWERAWREENRLRFSASAPVYYRPYNSRFNSMKHFRTDWCLQLPPSKALYVVVIISAQPTSRGAVGWCTVDLGRGRLWVRIPGKAWPQQQARAYSLQRWRYVRFCVSGACVRDTHARKHLTSIRGGGAGEGSRGLLSRSLVVGYSPPPPPMTALIRQAVSSRSLSRCVEFLRPRSSLLFSYPPLLLRFVLAGEGRDLGGSYQRELHRNAGKPAYQRLSSGTVTTLGNPGLARPGIEPGSPWWEASSLTAQPHLLSPLYAELCIPCLVTEYAKCGPRMRGQMRASAAIFWSCSERRYQDRCHVCQLQMLCSNHSATSRRKMQVSSLWQAATQVQDPRGRLKQSCKRLGRTHHNDARRDARCGAQHEAPRIGDGLRLRRPLGGTAGDVLSPLPIPPPLQHFRSAAAIPQRRKTSLSSTESRKHWLSRRESCRPRNDLHGRLHTHTHTTPIYPFPSPSVFPFLFFFIIGTVPPLLIRPPARTHGFEKQLLRWCRAPGPRYPLIWGGGRNRGIYPPPPTDTLRNPDCLGGALPPQDTIAARPMQLDMAQLLKSPPLRPPQTLHQRQTKASPPPFPTSIAYVLLLSGRPRPLLPLPRGRTFVMAHKEPIAETIQIKAVHDTCTGLRDEQFDAGHIWSRESGNSRKSLDKCVLKHVQQAAVGPALIDLLTATFLTKLSPLLVLRERRYLPRRRRRNTLRLQRLEPHQLVHLARPLRGEVRPRARCSTGLINKSCLETAPSVSITSRRPLALATSPSFVVCRWVHARAEWLDYPPPTCTNRVLIFGGVAPGFPHEGIGPVDAAGRRGFLGHIPLGPPFHSGAASCSPRSTLIGSQDLDGHSWKSRRYTQCDENTARQFRALRLAAMGHLMHVAVSTLEPLHMDADCPRSATRPRSGVPVVEWRCSDARVLSIRVGAIRVACSHWLKLLRAHDTQRYGAEYFYT
ncbi:hypothetical protein PR048_022057 [Dryococelus australis]|uniref:Uncharacterized protein n=1 Tax=Dryococelus australis TaxID=614101 RepID=A0ABQ9H014_9NEOP|nr:hypothetical protein PR048_022057 [Dryococelus australis]